MYGHGLSTRVKGIRVETGEEIADEIALEFPINIYINDQHFITVFATPNELKEMVIGQLLGYGIIENIRQIRHVEVDGLDVLVDLDINDDELKKRLEAYKTFKLIMTSCGSVEDYLKAFDRINPPRISSDFKIDAGSLRKVVIEFGRRSRAAVAVHTAGLYSYQEGEVIYVAMDVSRHITVDKVLGKAALQGADFSKCVLLTTGRQASDMVLKAARVGIPVTVSLRGPLFSGVYTALKTGVTMVSTVRGKGLTIYSHPERIINSVSKTTIGGY